MDTYYSSPEMRNLIKKQFGIIGQSGAINKAVDTLMQVAPTDLTVLITGETGTGKEVFVKALHGLSKRKKKPFLSVNCGAIPENLLESELFGHEKGAFTGAIEQRTGFFEAADNGTIFLDEIGEMPIQTQVKLLRVLESGEFLRIGSSKVKRVNVRIIAATNRDLRKEVEEGNFRQDLFFRLNSVHIILPVLKEHIEDIPLLLEYYGNKICKQLGVKYEGASKDATSILTTLPWQGNVREFRNLIETVITLEKTSFIDVDLLRKHIPVALPIGDYHSIPKSSSLVPIHHIEQDSSVELGLIFRTLIELKNDISDIKNGMQKLWEVTDSIKEDTEHLNYTQHKEVVTFEELLKKQDYTIEEIEKLMIVSSLKKNNNNRRKASESLGISPRTIYRKIDEYGIEDG